MTVSTLSLIPRWRLITSWVLMGCCCSCTSGNDRNRWGSSSPPSPASRKVLTHEIHLFAQGVIAWIVVAAVAIQLRRTATQVGVAAWKVSGWRFPLWAAGLMTVALGIAPLGMTSASQLSTTWAVLAIGWGTVFIAVGEREARTHVDEGPTPRIPASERS